MGFTTLQDSLSGAVPNSLLPTMAERVARARVEMAMGMPCIIEHGTDRAVAVPVETVAAQRFDALCEMFDQKELVITRNRARAVMTDAASADLADGPVRILPPNQSGLGWFRALSDPQSGHEAVAKGPLHVLRDGNDLLASAAMALVKQAELLPALILFPLPAGTARVSDLPFARIGAQSVLEHKAQQPKLAPVASAPLPLEAYDVTRLHVFRDPDGLKEHYAIVIGNPASNEPVLTRLHSACFTGDVLGSLKCDCGPQLRAALAMMGQEGAGVLLYLNQEGRGIGLANKMRVYDLQHQGLDTVEANHHLGYEDDERDFRTAATLLNALGFGQIRLLTNNPGKVDVLAESGIQITERLPLRVGRNAHNQNYLSVKALKSGHLL